MYCRCLGFAASAEAGCQSLRISNHFADNRGDNYCISGLNMMPRYNQLMLHAIVSLFAGMHWHAQLPF